MSASLTHPTRVYLLAMAIASLPLLVGAGCGRVMPLDASDASDASDAFTDAASDVEPAVDSSTPFDTARPDASVVLDAADALDAAPLLDGSTGIVTLAAPRHPRALSSGGGFGPPVVYTAEDAPGLYGLHGLAGWFGDDAYGNWGAAITPYDVNGIAWLPSIQPGRMRYLSFSGKPSGDLGSPDRADDRPGHYGAIMAMAGFDGNLAYFYVDQLGRDDRVTYYDVNIPVLADHGSCEACPPVQIGHVVAVGYLRFFIDSVGVYHVRSYDDSGAPATLLAALDEPPPETRLGNDLASDGTTLFYSDVGVHRRQLRSIPILGGAPRVLVDGLDATPGLRARPRLAVSGDSVYYTDGSNRLMVVPKTGGAPVILAEESGPIVDLFADGSHVYWIRDGALRRLDR